MAYLFKRKRSQYWWLGFIDPITGARKQESTQLRWAVTLESARAREIVDHLSEQEKRGLQVHGEHWRDFVPRFLAQRYAHTPSTLARYTGVWRNVSAFLRVRDIRVPRQLSRQAVRDYVEWRQERHAEEGCYEVTKNTALHELKVLRIVMNEAVASGFASVNPCLGLGNKPDPAPKKPRITQAEFEKIMNALKSEPEWMRVSFLIAWHQGCRFSETCLPLSDVDLNRSVIAFRTKGHKTTLAKFPLSPNLVPLIHELKRKGRKVTFEMPEFPGKAWWRFFRRIKLPKLCFHCTRVTFITRCYEQGISRSDVMRLVGHSSYSAHSVYPRLEADHRSAQSMRKLLDGTASEAS
jgi:integrase